MMINNTGAKKVKSLAADEQLELRNYLGTLYESVGEGDGLREWRVENMPCH